MSLGNKLVSDGAVYGASNHTDHAKRLVEEAEHALERDKLDDAIRWLDQAAEANERAQWAIDDARRRIKAARP